MYSSTVANANQSNCSESSTIDYNTTIKYTCSSGFSNTAGTLTRTCNADGSLTGSTPVCTSKFVKFVNA